MIRKRRAIASVIVIAVGAIAACLGPKLSSTEQAQIVVANGGSVTITPDTPVGQTGSIVITLSPASGSSSSMDLVESITENCAAFSLVLPQPFPATVSRSCGSAGSVGTAAWSPPHDEGYLVGDADDTSMCFDMNYSFTVNFTPSSAGPASCTVNISGASFSPVSVVVHANGVAPANGIEVPTTMLNFGDVRVGNSLSRTLNIRNSGTNPLNITSITASPATAYSIGAVTPNPIPSGQVVGVNVTCTPPPPNPGTYNSSIMINSSAGQRMVPATCNGVVTNLNVSAIDITARVGESVNETVTITNAGSGTASVIDDVLINPTNPQLAFAAKPPAGLTLGPGSSNSQLVIRYTPTAATTGTVEIAKLEIKHDSVLTRTAPINVTALETDIDVFPDVVDFGPVCAKTTEMKDVTVKAAKPGSFLVSSVSAPSAPFTFAARSGTVFPVTMMGNGVNTLTLTATVTPQEPGEATSMGSLALDIPGKTRQDIMFKAQVLEAGVGASPKNIDFGGVSKSQGVSVAMPTEVRNCSDQPLEITGLRFTGANPNDFQIILPAEDARLVTLQPQESITYQIVMIVTTPGVKTATLNIESPTSTAMVDLTGTTTGISTGGGSELTTYYACSTGHARNAGVLAFVVLLVLRRRRR